MLGVGSEKGLREMVASYFDSHSRLDNIVWAAGLLLFIFFGIMTLLILPGGPLDAWLEWKWR